MPVGGLVVNDARQVALSVEVPVVEFPLEDQGRGKGRGRVVTRLIPSMSMDEVPRRAAALLSPQMSQPDLVVSVELQMQLAVSMVCSCIAPPRDAPSRNSRTWLLSCWEGSISAEVLVVVVEVVGLVVVHAPTMATSARIPLLLLLLHPLLL